jgi:AAA domain
VSITLGGVKLEEPHAADQRFAGLIWGPAGAGKTVLASTGPGCKLHLCFDPDGELSLADRADVSVLRLYKINPTIVVGECRKPDPYNLTRYFAEHPECETVIFDSMTMFANMALQEAVNANKTPRNKVSMEAPSMAGYAYRNAIVLGAATNFLAVTAKANRNIIFTTHEGSGERDDDGNLVSITMILSMNLANQIGLRINEVWHLRDQDGKQRTISVRPHSRYTPMKTRMFDADKPQFTWSFDANTHIGEGIADWWDAWKKNGGRKISLPSVGKATVTKGATKKVAPTHAV